MNNKKEKIVGKKAVIFDVDNTVLDSTPMFLQAYENLRIVLNKRLGNDVSEKLMEKFMLDMYEEGGRYKGILDMHLISSDFTKGLIKRKLIEDKREVIDEIEKPLIEVYNDCPPFLSGAELLLKHLYSKGLKIAFCTHSGEWGNLKVKGIWSKMNFPKEELIYLTIPLEGKKDSNSWLKIIDMLKLKPSEVVVVGDNKEADIVEAQKIGVDTFIFYRYAVIHNAAFYKDDICIHNPGSVVYERDSLKDIIELF